MAKGENIFKRKDGRWEARYIKGHEISGKIHYGFCYGKTYKEAKEKVTQLKATYTAVNLFQSPKVQQRFTFYCDAWLKTNRGSYRASTYVKYAVTLEKHIKPALGGYYPLAINDSVTAAFGDKLLFEDKLAPKTVRDILTVLRSILKYTAKQFPGVFPQTEIRYPKDKAKGIRVLTEEEQKRLIRYLLKDLDECKFGILLALLTGMRIGELCALRWENISFADNTLKIAATMQRLKNMDLNNKSKTKVIIGSPKSDASKRIIPMNAAAVKLCERMRLENSSAFILTGTSAYMEPRLLQYRMERYTKDCGLEGVHFHTLRHTFATRCVEAGFELKSLSEILGHADTSTTLNRYVHSSMELKRCNMNRLIMSGF